MLFEVNTVSIFKALLLRSRHWAQQLRHCLGCLHPTSECLVSTPGSASIPWEGSSAGLLKYLGPCHPCGTTGLSSRLLASSWSSSGCSKYLGSELAVGRSFSVCLCLFLSLCLSNEMKIKIYREQLCFGDSQGMTSVAVSSVHLRLLSLPLYLAVSREQEPESLACVLSLESEAGHCLLDSLNQEMWHCFGKSLLVNATLELFPCHSVPSVSSSLYSLFP